MAALLCFPEGPGLHCRWFHGYAMIYVPSSGDAPHASAPSTDTAAQPSGGAKPLCLYAVKANEQYDCMCPSDGSYIEYHTVLLDLSDGLQCILGRVGCTGGTLTSFASTSPAAVGTSCQFDASAALTGSAALAVTKTTFPQIYESITSPASAPASASTPADTTNSSVDAGGLTIVQGNLLVEGRVTWEAITAVTSEHGLTYTQLQLASTELEECTHDHDHEHGHGHSHLGHEESVLVPDVGSSKKYQMRDDGWISVVRTPTA